MTTLDLLNQWLAADAEHRRLKVIADAAETDVKLAFGIQWPIEQKLAAEILPPPAEQKTGSTDSDIERHFAVDGGAIVVRRKAFASRATIELIEVEPLPASPTPHQG